MTDFEQRDADYEAAKNDLVAKLILEALQEQDVRTYSDSNSKDGGIGRLALDTAQKVQRQIRHGGFTS